MPVPTQAQLAAGEAVAEKAATTGLAPREVAERVYEAMSEIKRRVGREPKDPERDQRVLAALRAGTSPREVRRAFKLSSEVLKRLTKMAEG